MKKILKIDANMEVGEIKPEEKKKAPENPNYTLANSMNIGYYLITPLLVGVFLGFWLDNVFKSKPLFLLLFIGLGLVSSFYNLWRMIKDNDK